MTGSRPKLGCSRAEPGASDHAVPLRTRGGTPAPTTLKEWYGVREPKGEKQKDLLNAASGCKRDREIKFKKPFAFAPTSAGSGNDAI